jgi:hypothetical protein
MGFVRGEFYGRVPQQSGVFLCSQKTRIQNSIPNKNFQIMDQIENSKDQTVDNCEMRRAKSCTIRIVIARPCNDWSTRCPTSCGGPIEAFAKLVTKVIG